MQINLDPSKNYTTMHMSFSMQLMVDSGNQRLSLINESINHLLCGSFCGYVTNQGRCVNGTCVCMNGYYGPRCALFNCSGLPGNCENGICISPNECYCNVGYSGSDCSIFNCTDLADTNCTNYNCSDVVSTGCEAYGFCSGPNTCSCTFSNDTNNCTYYCDEIPDNCGEHGHCIGPNICNCTDDYFGKYCTSFNCNDIDNYCGNNGYCTGPDTCTCTNRYYGQDCTSFNCSGIPNLCGANGQCGSPNICICNTGYGGNDCTQTNCYNQNNCSSLGICIGPSQCQCSFGYTLDDCSTQLNEVDVLPNPDGSSTIINESLNFDNIIIGIENGLLQVLGDVNANDSNISITSNFSSIPLVITGCLDVTNTTLNVTVTNYKLGLTTVMKYNCIKGKFVNMSVAGINNTCISYRFIEGNTSLQIDLENNCNNDKVINNTGLAPGIIALIIIIIVVVVLAVGFIIVIKVLGIQLFEKKEKKLDDRNTELNEQSGQDNFPHTPGSLGRNSKEDSFLPGESSGSNFIVKLN